MLTVCIGKTGPEGSHRRWSHLEMRDWLVRRELRPRSLFVKCNEQDRSLGGYVCPPGHAQIQTLGRPGT